jgi:two-component system, NarL family, sensor histidine kinase UhpB
MWRRIALRHRLNMLFGALLLLWLLVDVGRILIDAGPRARDEEESMTRLTSQFVTTALSDVQEAADPEHALAARVASLQNLRHVRVVLSEGETFSPALVAAEDARSGAPLWFRRMVGGKLYVSAIPVVLQGRRQGSIFIVADPSDEVDEIWSAARTQALAGGALALAVVMAGSLFIRRALKPLESMGAELARLESGDYAARVEPTGSPEFVDTCVKINSLAQTLSELRAANGQLIERLFDAQDEERKAIAHELHDELGPHLFALRAAAAVLATRLSAGGHTSDVAAARSIADQVEALQGHNRRILARLRPAALEEFGLIEALRILVGQWRKAEPSVVLELSASERLAELGERASLTVYRFVQEALTNAFRHSGARRIDATLDYESTTAPRDGASSLAGLSIRIRDDGLGVTDGAAPSLGFLGMRERVQALGGMVAIGKTPSGGTTVQATFGPGG